MKVIRELDLCLKWSIGGLILLVPTCIIKPDISNWIMLCGYVVAIICGTIILEKEKK